MHLKKCSRVFTQSLQLGGYAAPMRFNRFNGFRGRTGNRPERSFPVTETAQAVEKVCGTPWHPTEVN